MADTRQMIAIRLAGIWLVVLVALFAPPGLAKETSDVFKNKPECLAILTDQSDPPLCVSGTNVIVEYADLDLGRRVDMKWSLLAPAPQFAREGTLVGLGLDCSGGSLWCSTPFSESFLVNVRSGGLDVGILVPLDGALSVTPQFADRPEAVTLGIELVRDNADPEPSGCLDFVSGRTGPLLCIVSKRIQYNPEDGDIADAVWVLATLDGTPVPEGVEVPMYAQLRLADASPVGRGNYTYGGSETRKGTAGMPDDQGLLVFHWNVSPDYQVLVTPAIGEDPAALLTIEITHPDGSGEPGADDALNDLVRWFAGN